MATDTLILLVAYIIRALSCWATYSLPFSHQHHQQQHAGQQDLCEQRCKRRSLVLRNAVSDEVVINGRSRDIYLDIGLPIFAWVTRRKSVMPHDYIFGQRPAVSFSKVRVNECHARMNIYK
jgi:hypothetical protein